MVNNCVFSDLYSNFLTKRFDEDSLSDICSFPLFMLNKLNVLYAISCIKNGLLKCRGSIDYKFEFPQFNSKGCADISELSFPKIKGELLEKIMSAYGFEKVLVTSDIEAVLNAALLVRFFSAGFNSHKFDKSEREEIRQLLDELGLTDDFVCSCISKKLYETTGRNVPGDIIANITDDPYLHQLETLTVLRRKGNFSTDIDLFKMNVLEDFFDFDNMVKLFEYDDYTYVIFRGYDCCMEVGYTSYNISTGIEHWCNFESLLELNNIPATGDSN